MNRDGRANFSSGVSKAGIGFVQAAALALAVTLAMPASAADRAARSKVAPVYPEIAKRMKITGSVKVQATVDAEGNVTAVKSLDGNRMLAAAAEDAVKKWKFAAGDAGEAVEVTLNFALAQ
jgi:TonB family protein